MSRTENAELTVIYKGRIRYVGNKDTALAMCNPGTELIDLHGATLYPGFIDSHMYLLCGAFLRTKTDLAECRSFSETMAVLRRGAEGLCV